MNNETAITLLTDPKLKLTARMRRAAKRQRQKVYLETPALIEDEETWTARPVPKDPMLRLTQKLASYSAGRLVRFIQQSARRAAGAKHLLAKLHPLSVFRPKLEEQQKMNLVAFVAATTELENRGKTA